MANKDAAFGLRPARMMNGSAFMNQQNRYRIASGATTAIFQGDLVEGLTAGTIGVKAAGETDAALGVFNGCRYTDPVSKKETFSNYYPGSIAGDTASGGSRDEIGVSTGATTNTLPLKAIDISQDPENSDVGSANTNVMVVINNHLLRAGTAGLA